MDNNVTFDEMNELLDEIYHSGGETWVEIDGQTYYTDWGYGVVGIEFFIRMLKNRKSDNDATQTRQDVVADVDEIIEHVINGNMLNMPYDVYLELFDAVDGLGVEIENLQTENSKLRELVAELEKVRKAFCSVNETRDVPCECCSAMWFCGTNPIQRMRELGVEVDAWSNTR